MKTLSITMDDDLYKSLRVQVPAGQISKYINQAVKSRIEEEQAALLQAYIEAAQDEERNAEIEEWDQIGFEGWGEDPDKTEEPKNHPKIKVTKW